MDFRDTREESSSDVSATVTEAPTKPASKAEDKAVDGKSAAIDSKTVLPLPFPVDVDHARDALLTDFGKETLRDRYLLPGESYQDLFVRVASAYADDAAHAQRVYD